MKYRIKIYFETILIFDKADWKLINWYIISVP